MQFTIYEASKYQAVENSIFPVLFSALYTKAYPSVERLSYEHESCCGDLGFFSGYLRRSQ